jgi:hypothetical protein
MTHFVDEWAATKPRYKELGPLILRLIEQTPKNFSLKDEAEAKYFLDDLYDIAAKEVDGPTFTDRLAEVVKALGILLLVPVVLGALALAIAIPPIGALLLLGIIIWLVILESQPQKSDPDVVEYYRAQYAANRAIEEYYLGKSRG